MRFREDILRGIRLGAILLATLLIGIAAYRILSATPAPKAKQQQKKALPAIANAPPFVVPPAPPIHRKASKRAVAQTTNPAESISQTPVVSTDTEVVAVEQEKKGPDAAAEKVEATAPEPVRVGEATQNPGSRGRRWLRSVGHFLHIGPKKDLPSQAVQQP